MPKRKKHWTQTAAGRAKMAENARIKNTKKHDHEHVDVGDVVIVEKDTIISPLSFAFGHVQNWLSGYADSVGLDRGEFIVKVGNLLVTGGIKTHGQAQTAS